METVIILALLLVLMLSGLPIAFSLMGLGMGLLAYHDLPMSIATHSMLGTMDNFVLVAVPLFILMSNVLIQGGVGDDLFTAVQSWVGHWPGGLAVATILSCGIFSAISGSSVATAATVGVVAIPEMLKRDYPPSFAYGLVAAGGTLGILIPPSIPMIIFGVITEESTSDLFLAGMFPGLILVVGFILISMVIGWRRGLSQPRASFAERVKTTKKVWPVLLLVFIILYGIYFGIFTPTEAAGIGFVMSLFLTGVVMRRQTWEKIKGAVMGAMTTTISLLFIVLGAGVFGKAITLMRLPQDVSLFIVDNIATPGMFVLATCAILLLMGFVMETIAMTLIMVPIIYPSLAPMGLDPIWFGVVFVVIIECALLTPPVGMNLFVIQSIANARLEEVIKGVYPFLILMVLLIFALYFLPAIALFIPFGV